VTPGPELARTARREVVAGVVLLAWTAAAAVIIRRSPGLNPLDRWGFDVVGPQLHSSLYLDVSRLGGAAVLVVGALAAGAIALRRDVVRAGACVVSPFLATALVEWVLKPGVGRRYGGALTFPSGSVVVIASVATALSLAVTGRLRWVVIATGAVLVTLMCAAVVGLQWHYPSDALAGATFATGIVLLVDGGAQALFRPHGS